MFRFPVDFRHSSFPPLWVRLTALSRNLADEGLFAQIYEPIFIDSDEDDEMDDDPNTSLPVAPSVSVAWSAHSSGKRLISSITFHR